MMTTNGCMIYTEVTDCCKNIAEYKTQKHHDFSGHGSDGERMLVGKGWRGRMKNSRQLLSMNATTGR